ncbi:unnamed protein product [Litomosoides sigmodontis]|uniref:Uncharacterized protein n=1 Tax=Litomosoides sigmodontis TaxID=42156 RepID=A0A3P6V5G2_LITSI|nr:unnamed protein product [Litomosoides sigmodontis]
MAFLLRRRSRSRHWTFGRGDADAWVEVVAVANGTASGNMSVEESRPTMAPFTCSSSSKPCDTLQSPCIPMCPQSACLCVPDRQ